MSVGNNGKKQKGCIISAICKGFINLNSHQWCSMRFINDPRHLPGVSLLTKLNTSIRATCADDDEDRIVLLMMMR